VRKTVSAKNEKFRGGLSFLHGNLAAIAVSSAIGGFGVEIIRIWGPRYFDELGGDPFTLGLMTFATLMVQCVMFLLGGFLFQTVNPVAPFYLFAAAELIAALFLASIVREPVKKKFNFIQACFFGCKIL
jgi:hypothetical protein